MKKVSIVIAAYNVEPYICRCIDSILSQTYKNIEIVIVDDGSTDNTASFIEKYLSNWDNIRLVSQDNGGVSKARNNALTYATGDYICIFDSDDFMNKNHIETLVSLYASADNIDCAILGYAQYSHKNDTIIKEVQSTEGIFNGKELAERLIFHKGNENLIAGVNNKLYSSSIIRKHKITYNENLSYGEDWLFNIEYYMHCRKVAISNHITSNYVQYDEARLSTVFRPDGCVNSIYIRKCLYNIFPDIWDVDKFSESILRTTDYYNKYYVRNRGFYGFVNYCKNILNSFNSENITFTTLSTSKRLNCRHKALLENKSTRYILLNILYCSAEYIKYSVSTAFIRQ